MSTWTHLLVQLGSSNLKKLMDVPCRQIRSEIISKWFQTLSIKTICQAINKKSNNSESKLKMIFLSKYNGKQLERDLERLSMIL